MAFKNAMNKSSLTLVNTPRVVTPQVADNKTGPLPPINSIVNPPSPLLSVQPEMSPRIEHVINKNRFNVYFERKPDEIILNKLRAANFWWDVKIRAWFNKDCAETRDFLERTFNADLSGVAPLKNDDNDVSPNQTFGNATQNAPEAPKPPKIEPLVDLGLDEPEASGEQDEASSPTISDELDAVARERHRKQVKELLDAMGVTPGVLMELAIDFLHNATFNKVAK